MIQTEVYKNSHFMGQRNDKILYYIMTARMSQSISRNCQRWDYISILCFCKVKEKRLLPHTQACGFYRKFIIDAIYSSNITGIKKDVSG